MSWPATVPPTCVGRTGTGRARTSSSGRLALATYAIRPMQQFAYSTGKNASDMALVIDAMDLVHRRSLDALAIYSSDADFTPLVMRVLAEGMKVYGFGEKKTPEPFVNACSQFVYVEALGQPTNNRGNGALKAAAPQNVGDDARLIQMLRRAVDAVAADDGWAHLGAVGNQIGNQASFDPRNYGYRKLSDLVEATGLFEVKRQDLVVFVRDKGPA